jgi:para-nitrobenzyl esterase
MQAYWTNFAKSADPNGPGLPSWPQFRSSADSAMILGERIQMQGIEETAELQRINRLYATVRTVTAHPIATVALLIAALIGTPCALVIGFRRWRRQLRARAAQMPAA